MKVMFTAQAEERDSQCKLWKVSWEQREVDCRLLLILSSRDCANGEGQQIVWGSPGGTTSVQEGQQVVWGCPRGLCTSGEGQQTVWGSPEGCTSGKGAAGSLGRGGYIDCMQSTSQTLPFPCQHGHVPA